MKRLEEEIKAKSGIEQDAPATEENPVETPVENENKQEQMNYG